MSASSGGTPATLSGDGGSSSADTPGPENHIKIAPADFAVVCQVREFSVDISREELTSLLFLAIPAQAAAESTRLSVKPSPVMPALVP